MNERIEFDKCEGIIFDLDGTLIDSMWVWKKIDVDFLGKRGYEVPDDYLDTITPMGFERCADYTISRFNLDQTRDEVIREWYDMAIDSYRKDVFLKPGAKDFLDYLKDRNIKMSIATASDMTLVEPVLENNNIIKYFNNITTLREVHKGKGNPDVYNLAADKMRVDRKGCVVFEDIIEGLKGARLGGYKTVGVYDEHSKDTVEDLVKLSDMFIYNFKECM